MPCSARAGARQYVADFFCLRAATTDGNMNRRSFLKLSAALTVSWLAFAAPARPAGEKDPPRRFRAGIGRAGQPLSGGREN